VGEGTWRLLAEPSSGCYAETADRFHPCPGLRKGRRCPVTSNNDLFLHAIYLIALLDFLPSFLFQL
jgi:hypothetical protein